MKKLIIASIFCALTFSNVQAKEFEPINSGIKLPKKYTQNYIDNLSEEYGKICDNQVIHVALDMMKGSSGEFSRKAILGNNLTQKPIKIQFKDLSELNPAYSSFDAVGWKKKGKLYIYINPKHQDAPPAALAALLSHEALHQDEYNSLSEETYAWTMEAVVWRELLERFPESNNLESELVTRENILKQLYEKGGLSNKYIKKTVYSNEGYKDLPLNSPGFSNQ